MVKERKVGKYCLGLKVLKLRDIYPNNGKSRFGAAISVHWGIGDCQRQF